MADLTTQTASATAAGVGAAVVAVIGIDPQALLWAFVGGSIGITFAAPAGRWRAAVVFVAVVFSCAQLGSWMAWHLFGDDRLARNGCPLLLGMAFHPLLSASVAAIPGIVKGALRRIGVEA